MVLVQGLRAVERAEHVLISGIVAETKDKLGWLADLVTVRLDETLGDLALVDKGGAHFEVCFAGHDFHFPFLSYAVLKLLLALARLVETPFGIGLAVVPG